MQARLAETFQRSGEFGGVGKPGEGLAIDYQVIAEIRAFEVRVDGGAARRGRAVRPPAQRPQRRGARRKDLHRHGARSPATGNDAYVGALDAAFGQAAVEIVDWTGKII